MLSKVQKAAKFEYSNTENQLKIGKRVISSKKCHQKFCAKDAVNKTTNTTKKWVRILICAIQNNVAKVERKHLVFHTSVVKIHTYLLIDNNGEARLIDESFVYTNKISIFKFKKEINLILENVEVVQDLTKETPVDVEIKDHKD